MWPTSCAVLVPASSSADDMKLLGQHQLFSGLLIAAAIVTQPSSLRALEREDPGWAAVRHYKTEVERTKNLANAWQRTVDIVQKFSAMMVEARGMNEIAASIDRGREVQVFVLHKHIPGSERDVDLLMEVSPHPYPQFLVEPGTSYRVERKSVIGTGTYLQAGAPPYPKARDFVPRGTSIGPAQDALVGGRNQAQWN